MLSVTTELEYPSGVIRAVVLRLVLAECYGAGSLRGEPLRVGDARGALPPLKGKATPPGVR